MRARSPNLSVAASAAIRRRVRRLRRERGARFAQDWEDGFLTWLERIAQNGAVIGTRVPNEPGLRSFPYKRQATILAEFTDTELRIIRIYFAGQDWMG